VLVDRQPRPAACRALSSVPFCPSDPNRSSLLRKKLCLSPPHVSPKSCVPERQQRYARGLSLLFSHYSALFCHSKKHNSRIFNIFHALCRKHPGWGVQRNSSKCQPVSYRYLFTSLLLYFPRHYHQCHSATHKHPQLHSPQSLPHTFRHHGGGGYNDLQSAEPLRGTRITHSVCLLPSRRMPLFVSGRALSPPVSAPLCGPVLLGGSTLPLALPGSAANLPRSATRRDRQVQ